MTRRYRRTLIDQSEVALELFDSGKTYKEIARQFDVWVRNVGKWLEQARARRMANMEAAE